MLNIIKIPFLLSSLIIFLFGCSSSLTNEGGETCNERTVAVFMPNGTVPADGAEVTIGKADSSKNTFIYAKTSTDSNGRYTIPMLLDGQYTIYIQKVIPGITDTLVAYQKSVFISLDSHSVLNDTLRQPATISGYVKLQPNDPTSMNTVIVNILGTQRYANVDKNGRFTLHNLASGAEYYLMFTTSLPGYISTFVSDIIPKDSISLLLDTVELVYNGIPLVPIKSLDYDPITGVVSLCWDSTSYTDHLEFQIFRKPVSQSVIQSVNQIHLANTDKTSFNDTIFAEFPNSYQHFYDDQSDYTYIYRISILDRKLKEGPIYYDLNDRITVKSPLLMETIFSYTLHDFSTDKLLEKAALNQSVYLIFTIKNSGRLLNKIKILDINSGLTLFEKDHSTAKDLIIDTINYQWNSPGFQDIMCQELDTSENKVLCETTLKIEVTDVNLTLQPLLFTPSIPICKNTILITVPVKNTGTTILKDAHTSLSLIMDSLPEITTKIDIDSLKPGDTDTFEFNTENTNGYLSELRGGIHSFTITIDGDNQVTESYKNDNSITFKQSFSDIDLTIKRMIFDPVDFRASDRVLIKALVKNQGTTNLDSGHIIGVSFDVDGRAIAKGSILGGLKAGDSVVIEGNTSVSTGGGALWYVNAGSYPVSSEVDFSCLINESVEENNVFEMNITKSDFDLDVSSFNVFPRDLTRSDNLSFEVVIINWGIMTTSNIPLKVLFLVNEDTSAIFDTLISEIGKAFSLPLTINCGSGVPNGFCMDDTSSIFETKVIIDPDSVLSEVSRNDNWESSICFIRNLIPNGNMETTGVANEIKGWNHFTINESTEFTWTKNGRNGRGLKIFSFIPEIASWYIPVEVKEKTSYRLSGWVKGESVTPQNEGDTTIFLGFHGTGFDIGLPLTGTFDWTYIESTIKSFPLDLSVPYNIECRLGDYLGKKAYGIVYFDDIKLEIEKQ